MASAPYPAFLLDAADFLSDERVFLMSLQARGAYITLLCRCWQEGSIPSDMALMGRLVGVGAVEMAGLWEEISQKFSLRDDLPNRYVHPELEAERVKQERSRQERSEGGRAGAAKRWQKGEASPEPNGHGEADPQSAGKDSHKNEQSPANETPTSSPNGSVNGEANRPPNAKRSKGKRSKEKSQEPSPAVAGDGTPPPAPPEGVGSEPTAAEVQEKRRRAAETLKNHPVVAAVRSVRRKTPDPQHWERMIATVERAGPLDVPFMGKCWQEWYDRGYNRDSWKWLTDWYCHRVIPEPGERYDPDVVGQYQPPPEEPLSPDGPKRLSGADLGNLADAVRTMVQEQGREFRDVVEQLSLEALHPKDYLVVAKPICPRCGGSGMESVPGKGARPCDHRVAAELPQALDETGGEDGGERGNNGNAGENRED